MVEEVSVEGLGGSYKGGFLSTVGHDVMGLSLTGSISAPSLTCYDLKQAAASKIGLGAGL